MIACPLGHVELKNIADDGGEDGNDGDPAVADGAVGEESEGVET